MSVFVWNFEANKMKQRVGCLYSIPMKYASLNLKIILCKIFDFSAPSMIPISQPQKREPESEGHITYHMTRQISLTI